MSRSKILGAEDLAKALKELGGAIGAPINAAARKALRPMLAAAKKNAPVDEGHLKKSLTIKASSRSPKNQPRFVVGPNAQYQIDGDRPVKYAHITEFGKADGSVKGTRWLTRSFEETSGQTIEILRVSVNDEIHKAAARKAARRAKT